MFRQYLQQSLYHLRENPVITWVSLLGTALSICMIMVVVITLRARIVDCAPEVNRSRTLYVPNMTARPKTATDGGMNSRMSVQTGRECFKALTMPEAVTLYTDVDKVRASLPAGDKLTADMRQVDSDFWHIFHFRFLDGKPFSEADFQSALPRTVISATVARRLFGRTEGVAGQHLQLNHVDYQVVGVVADVSMLAADSYAQVWIPYTTGTAEAILAKRADDFAAIRAECERLRQRYNEAQPDMEVVYLGQPDTQFTHLYRTWAEVPDMSSVVMRYVAVLLILLIVPAINLSSMTHSRMRKRMAEIGVRRAFGATRRELVTQILCENLLQTLMGGVLGLVVSYVMVAALPGWLLAADDTGISQAFLNADMLFNPVIFALAFLACLLLNLLSAGIPAWRSARAPIVRALNT